MRILFVTGREINYPRNDVILRALNRIGEVDVVEIKRASSSLLLNSLILSLRTIPKLISGGFSLVFVGFYGHLLMLPVGLLTRQPILFDAFVSTYDTLCFDRKVFSPSSLAGKSTLWLDRFACRLASHILLDTPLHVEYYIQTIGLPPDKLSALPVGCNEDVFYPRTPPGSDQLTIVLFYSTYLPLHGVDTVVRAAALLRPISAIRFRIIGKGQEFDPILRLARSLDLQNIDFLPPVPLELLPDEIAAAHICLGGHFGRSDKAGRVVPGKIYQILAMGRPLVATNTLANLNLLSHGKTAYLCSPGDPDALASAILDLHKNVLLRTNLAEEGQKLYLQRCSEAVITAQLRAIVDKMTER